MLSFLNQPTARSLILNLLVTLSAVSAINGFIFGFNWGVSTEAVPRFAPPGYLVSIVWTVLFTLMATARWRLNFYKAIGASQARTWVTFLIASCLLYPLYSLALDSMINGLLGNLETIALTTFVIVRVWSISKPTALLLVPIIPWVMFATTTILRDLGWW